MKTLLLLLACASMSATNEPHGFSSPYVAESTGTPPDPTPERHDPAAYDPAVTERLLKAHQAFVDMNVVTKDSIGACFAAQLALCEQARRQAVEERDELRRNFVCFRCGDGATPLYCLNCAAELNNAQRPRPEEK